MKYSIDKVRFCATVKAKRSKEKMSYRQAASEIGEISPSTLVRMERGILVDLDLFLSVCGWLEMNPSEFITSDNDNLFQNTDATTPEMIEVLLHSDKTLDPSITTSLIQIIWSTYNLNNKLQT